MAESDSVPFWWLVLFLLLALGLGAATVLGVGGSIIAGVIAPAPIPVAV
jgi:predicted secreted protein